VSNIVINTSDTKWRTRYVMSYLAIHFDKLTKLRREGVKYIAVFSVVIMEIV